LKNTLSHLLAHRKLPVFHLFARPSQYEGGKEGRMGKLLLLLLLRWKTVVDHHYSFCFHFSIGEEEEEEEEQQQEEEERQNGKTVEGMGITSVGAHSGSFQIRVCFLFMEIPSSLLNGCFLVRLLLIFLIQC